MNAVIQDISRIWDFRKLSLQFSPYWGDPCIHCVDDDDNDLDEDDDCNNVDDDDEDDDDDDDNDVPSESNAHAAQEQLDNRSGALRDFPGITKQAKRIEIIN